MKKERSYGAVVFSKEGKVLIENMRLGHVSIPKGHIEEGETPKECALREIKEETNLDVLLDMNFEEDEEYSPFEGIIKKVTFYVADYLDDKKPVPQKEEVDSIVWMDQKEAEEALTFPSDKKIVFDAIKYWNNRK